MKLSNDDAAKLFQFLGKSKVNQVLNEDDEHQYFVSPEDWKYNASLADPLSDGDLLLMCFERLSELKYVYWLRGVDRYYFSATLDDQESPISDAEAGTVFEAVIKVVLMLPETLNETVT